MADQVKYLVPILLVFVAFVCALGAYVALSIQGTATGPVDELVTGLGTAVAALAAPTAVAWRTANGDSRIVADEPDVAPRKR